MASEQERKFARLRQWNVSLGLLHLIQAIIMFVLSSDFSLPIQTTFLQGNAGPGQGAQVVDVLINLRLGPMVGLFLLASAVAHFSLASPWGYPWYVENLKKGINPARWYEYAVSSSIMIIVIAMLCGIFELSSLILIFCLNATMNLFGLMMELHNQTTKKTDWTAFIFGCFAGIVPWIVLAIYFFGAILSAGDNVPTFVYFILPIIAIFYNIFAINMVLQYRKKGRWSDYLFGEKVYMLLSLTSKSILAWFVFGGTLA